MSEPTTTPTEADLARDLSADLALLACFGGDIYHGFYSVNHHRTAIRRALAAEEERDRLREALERIATIHRESANTYEDDANDMAAVARAALEGKG